MRRERHRFPFQGNRVVQDGRYRNDPGTWEKVQEGQGVPCGKLTGLIETKHMITLSEIRNTYIDHAQNEAILAFL